MKSKKTTKVAIYAILAKITKVFSGPVIIILIASKLSLPEISVYYTFFSLIAMQQLLELGIGNVIKQFISHSWFNDEIVNDPSQLAKIKGYFYFSLMWFAVISLFILLTIGPLGLYFFNDIHDVNWFYPWCVLIVSVSLTTIFTPILFLIEGVQQQEKLYKYTFLCSLINPIIFIVCISIGLKLYSIGISLFLSQIILYFFLTSASYKYIRLIVQNKTGINIRKTFNEISSLLLRVSIVWGIGYFFWNSFNLIVYFIFPPEEAGRLLFSYNLALSGYNIAQSVILSQLTIYGNLISNNKIEAAFSLFKKNRFLSITILLSGYLAFLLAIYANFHYLEFFYNKLVSTNIILMIFVFFILLNLLTVNNNFIRCFKVEPFVKISIFQGILIPTVYLLFLGYSITFSFFLACIILIISIFFSKKISSKYLKWGIYEQQNSI